MSKHFQSILFGFVCVTLGVAFGWLGGRATHEAGERGVLPPKGPNPTSSTANPIPATELMPQPSEPRAGSPLERLHRAASRVSAENLAACLAAIAELPLGDCPAANALFERWPDEHRKVLQQFIAQRWAYLDAEGALHVAFSHRDIRSQLPLIQEAARAVARRSVDAAQAHFLALKGPQERRLFGRFVVEAVAEQNPARAAELLATWPELTRDEDLFGSVGALWARSHPREAFAWAVSLPSGRTGGDAFRAVLSAWAETDPAAVASEAARIQGKRVDPDVYAAIARAWSKSDPTAAVAWLGTLATDEQRRAAWDGFAPIARIEDGPAMLRLIQSIPAEHNRGKVADRIAGQFAQQNPRQALAWAEMLEGEARRHALRPVLTEWARIDPAQAVDYAAALKDNYRMELLRPAFGQWAGTDTASAMNWIQQLPPNADREQLAAEAGRAMRDVDPAKSVAWLDFVAAPDLRRKLVDEIAGQWGRVDGLAAASWVQELPDDESRIRGHRSLARQWAFVDADAAAQWLAALPSGAARDAAIDSYVSSVDGYDPALATAWAAAIDEPQRRAEKVAAAWSRWNGSDPERARNWLEQAAIDPQLRANLQRSTTQRPR